MHEERRFTDLKNRALYWGIEPVAFREILPVISKENHKIFHNLNKLCILMFLLLALCSFAPHFEAFIGQHRFMFVLFAILSVIMKFVSDYISSRTLTFAFPLCYILLGILLAFGIVLSPAVTEGASSTVFLVILFSIPLVITDLPARVSIFMISAGAIYILSFFLNKTSSLYERDILSVVVLLGVSIVTGFYVQEVKIRQLILLKKVERERDTDGLTRLLSKEAGTRDIKEFMQHNPAMPATFVIFDLDNFKGINDTYGHMFGDVVLAMIGSALRQVFRENDIVMRFGGDEFVMFLPGVGNEQNARASIQKVRILIEQEIENLPQANEISCSFGAAFFPEHSSNYEALFAMADKALYEAKHSGKDTCCIYQ